MKFKLTQKPFSREREAERNGKMVKFMSYSVKDDDGEMHFLNDKRGGEVLATLQADDEIEVLVSEKMKDDKIYKNWELVKVNGKPIREIEGKKPQTEPKLDDKMLTVIAKKLDKIIELMQKPEPKEESEPEEEEKPEETTEETEITEEGLPF